MLLQRTATSEAPYPTKQPLTTSPIMPWGVDNTRLADLFNAALTANTMLALTKNSLSLYFSVRGCFGVYHVFFWFTIKRLQHILQKALWRVFTTRQVKSAASGWAAHAHNCPYIPLHLCIFPETTRSINISPECTRGDAGINTQATKSTIRERALSAFKNSDRSQYT